MSFETQFRMLCLPEQEPIITTVFVSLGWSESRRDICTIAAAYNSDDTQASVQVVERYPADCIPLPEPDMASALMVGILLLGVLFEHSRSDSRQRTLPRLWVKG